jgi:hypothetical protein
MADAGKEAAPEVVTTEAATPPAPSPNASVKVQCAHPTSRFVAAKDVPVVTKQGVKLTKAQYEVVKEAAERSGVRLIVNDGEGVK